MVSQLFPEAAATNAIQEDTAFLVVMGVCLFFFILVVVVMTYFCVKYRKGSSADRTGDVNSLPFELTWTAIPTLIGMGLFLMGASGYHDQKAPPPDAMEINVVGKQWMWKIQHPEGPREIDELHVPVNRPVKLLMTSEDVIHDFFIPAFRIKFDVLPGRVTTEWFQALKVGEYHLFCSQYCGFDHSEMTGKVVVMAPQDYQQWLIHGSSGPWPVAPVVP
ncbi:MAG TPA: cytochrome c oxidase subunit II [Candidatus Xenobia bacterium]